MINKFEHLLKNVEKLSNTLILIYNKLEIIMLYKKRNFSIWKYKYIINIDLVIFNYIFI